MEISFGNSKLQKLCEQSTKAQRELGTDCAKRLHSRLADLMAAESVQDLVAGRPHPLQGDRQGQFSLSLAGAKRLVFESVDEPIPVGEDGSIIWSKVTQVRIVFIGDYHD